jgi:hypothetical protein
LAGIIGRIARRLDALQRVVERHTRRLHHLHLPHPRDEKPIGKERLPLKSRRIVDPANTTVAPIKCVGSPFGFRHAGKSYHQPVALIRQSQFEDLGDRPARRAAPGPPGSPR